MDRVLKNADESSPTAASPEAGFAQQQPTAGAESLSDSGQFVQRLRQLPPITPLATPASFERSSRDNKLPLRDEVRIRLAWAKLLWLLTFLGVLLALTYLIPHMVEQIQYASTRVGPSVVHIMAQSKISQVAQAGGGLGGAWRIPHDGQGSGFVVDKQGHIVTNFHVIDGAEEIEVLLSDGRRAAARIVGQDRETDLALLKVDADGLIPAEWGESDQAEVGSFVWAIGSPFGLQRSVTSGIISGKHRTGMSRSPYQDFLQTDAAVNPGNSGGPLVDAKGHVIGVNTAIVGDSYQGISFAIPSQIAQQIIARLKDEGSVSRGWLGVELAEVENGAASATATVPLKGAVVVRVINLPDQRSPASLAGIQQGDIVLRWDDRDVTNPAELRQFVAETKIGSRVKATVNRGGSLVELEVEVGQRPGEL
jgi:serine protease Do